MKNLIEFINESLLGGRIPNKMPKDVIIFLQDCLKDEKIKDKEELYDYLRFSCDEFWDMVINKFNMVKKINSGGSKDIFDIVWVKWQKQIEDAIL